MVAVILFKSRSRDQHNNVGSMLHRGLIEFFIVCIMHTWHTISGPLPISNNLLTPGRPTSSSSSSSLSAQSAMLIPHRTQYPKYGWLPWLDHGKVNSMESIFFFLTNMLLLLIATQWMTLFHWLNNDYRLRHGAPVGESSRCRFSRPAWGYRNFIGPVQYQEWRPQGWLSDFARGGGTWCLMVLVWLLRSRIINIKSGFWEKNRRGAKALVDSLSLATGLCQFVQMSGWPGQK